MSLNQECINIILAIVTIIAAFIYQHCTLKKILYWYYAFLCVDNLLEDGDISLKQVGCLCLWISYDLISCICWHM
jgi:hypothetical protein